MTPLSYEHELFEEFAAAVIEELEINGCDGTLVVVLTILRDDLGFDPPATAESLQWLRALGGRCLCTVALNVIGNAPDPDESDPDKLTT